MGLDPRQAAPIALLYRPWQAGPFESQ